MNQCLTLIFLVSWVASLRILSVFPSPTRSHYLSVRPILLELLKRGHEVVSISPFEEGSRINYTWLEVEAKTIFDAVPNLREELGQDFYFFGYLKFVWRTMNKYVTYITKKPKLAAFMRNDTSHFDLILAHDFFQTIFYTFADKYKAPLIVMSSFGHAHYIHSYMGGHFDLTYPHEFTNLEYPLSLYDKIRNVVYILYDIVGRRICLHRYQNSLAPDLFGYKPPNLEVLERNIDLVLINSHFTTSIPRTNLPNIVEVGGVHIAEVKPLNQEFQNILDGAEAGVILLSLGSIIELNAQEELFSHVIKVLGSLKQRVIMKWNSEKTISEYPNIYTFSWLPQNDILAHPNMKLFINHGGALSNHEAVFHGVPVICVPFQANQHQVCQASVKNGYAIRILKDQLSNFNESIRNILADERFKLNALKTSRRFKNRPASALDTACFWIENCSRNKTDFQNNEVDWLVILISLSIIFLLLVFITVIKRNKVSVKVKQT